jgi:hypothetical protein
MVADGLSVLVQRALSDAAFRRRLTADLEGTLRIEGIVLSPEEIEAVRAFQTELAGLPPDEVNAHLAAAGRRRGAY